MNTFFTRRIRALITPTAFAVIFLSSVQLGVFAQAPGSSRGLASSDGFNQIQGRVHFPSGQAVDSKTVKVSLESASLFGLVNTVTEPDGSFRFTSLQAGQYTVVVNAGKEYEIARESVNLDRESSKGGRTVQVAIHLRLKVDATNPAFANVPAGALSDYEKGVAAAKKGNSKAAVEAFSNAVKTYPNFPVALAELGMQYMLLKDMTKAAETFEELVKLKPLDAFAHLNLGIALFNLKKFEEAEANLLKALKLNNSGPTAHYYLGLTYISLKRYDESQKEFELAISNGGENLPLAHKFLGGLYMSAKRNQQAADELEKYLKLDPKAADAERIKGTIKELRSKP
jgi:tetratricopeptide (TPR) repeat protein